MIYTKTGDKGETSLANGQRVSKTDLRLEAYGTVDELNSWIGLLRASDGEWLKRSTADGPDRQLARVQNLLFNLGAALSCAPGEWIAETDVCQLEQWIDAMQQELPRQKAFVLPVGGEAVGRCHVCRTICRRAERAMLRIEEADEQTAVLLQFINRLSDYLFVLARYIGFVSGEKEEFWQK